MPNSKIPAYLILITAILAIFVLFYAVSINAPKNKIYGFTVNHHLFAANLIDEIFKQAQNENPEVIVLISPNHFNFGKYPLLTTKKTWPTDFGVLEPKTELIDSLMGKSDLNIEDLVFEREHGIFNIIPYVKKYFTNSQIMPIIVKETVSKKELDQFADTLENLLPADALIIGSFDFSHNKVSALADLNDAQSQKVLESLDYKNTAGLDIDSTMGLRLLLKSMALKQANHFTLISHNSSAKMTNNLTTTDNTTYLNGTFTR